VAKKQIFAGLAATAVIIGSIAAGLPAQASVNEVSASARAAHAVSPQAGNQPVVPLIDARPCDTSQTPKQIRLVLAPGAVICYGGTVGNWDLGQLYVQSLVAGGYWGWLRCEDSGGVGAQHFFQPGDIFSVNDTCQVLAITPPRS
jgi:hypothetical protein